MGLLGERIEERVEGAAFTETIRVDARDGARCPHSRSDVKRKLCFGNEVYYTACSFLVLLNNSRGVPIRGRASLPALPKKPLIRPNVRMGILN